LSLLGFTPSALKTCPTYSTSDLFTLHMSLLKRRLTSSAFCSTWRSFPVCSCSFNICPYQNVIYNYLTRLIFKCMRHSSLKHFRSRRYSKRKSFKLVSAKWRVEGSKPRALLMQSTKFDRILKLHLTLWSVLRV
jgi:hypothetical protein